MIPQASIEWIPKIENNKLGALAKLAKELVNPNKEELLVLIQNMRVLAMWEDTPPDPQAEEMHELEEAKYYREPFVFYLKDG